MSERKKKGAGCFVLASRLNLNLTLQVGYYVAGGPPAKKYLATPMSGNKVSGKQILF